MSSTFSESWHFW